MILIREAEHYQCSRNLYLRVKEQKGQAEQLAMMISSTLDDSNKANLVSVMKEVPDRACERLDTQTKAL
jgi:hypothetical protein